MKKKVFLSGSLLSMIEQGFSSITSFLTGVIVAHSCDMGTAGTYALVLSIAMIVLGMQRVLIAVPFNVHYPQLAEGKDKKNYFAATNGWEIISLVFLGGIAALISGFVDLQVKWITGFIFFTGYLLKDFARQFFFGIGRVLMCLLMSMTQCLIQLGILFWKASQGLSMQEILNVIGGTCFICSLLFLLPYMKISLQKENLKSAWQKNWWTAKWSIGISLSDACKNQLSVWLLKLFQSNGAVAVFNNNNTLATLPQPIFVGLSQFLLPNLSAARYRENTNSLLKKIKIICLIAVSCNLLWSIGLLVIGRILVIYLYGTEYFIGIAPLMICCIRGIFMSLNNIQSAVLQAFEEPQIILQTLVISLCFLITGGTILIWMGGITGACLAMLIVYAIPALLQFKRIRNIFGKGQIDAENKNEI